MPQEIEFDAIRRLDGAIIVSSQASQGEPLCAPGHIMAMALSAIAGGAWGMRLEGLENVTAARQDPRVPPGCPIIGLVKDEAVEAGDRLGVAYITNSFDDAHGLARAGADIIALDATGRPRRDGLSVAAVIERIHSELHKPVWADIATLSEGIQAVQSGADVVSTTLFGYTAETAAPHGQGPNFQLLQELLSATAVPVILEGRVWHPQEVERAFALGAYAVVVGSAITRPQLISERFVKAVPAARRKAAVR